MALAEVASAVNAMRTEDWLSSYAAYTEQDVTSPLFKRWAGVFIIAAAVQRRVWLLSRGDHVYPTLYVLLCGASAAGKGVALGPLANILDEDNFPAPDHYTASSSVTAASLVDELTCATVSLTPLGREPVQYNALTVISTEFGVFLPSYDYTMLNLITDLYDGKRYTESRRTRDKRTRIPNPCLNIIGGTTPAYLNNFLHEGAWEEGFMSRILVVHGQSPQAVEIVEEGQTRNARLQQDLIHDLRLITKRYGRVRWDPEALAAFNKWYVRDNGKPRPSHPKLKTYNERRHYHMMKLCLIHCLSRGGERIEEPDFILSLDLLLETESVMPDTFKAMRTGGDQQVIREAYHYVETYYLKHTKPVRQDQLFRFLSDRVPAYSVKTIVENMVKGKLIRVVRVEKLGDCFKPGRKEDD